MSPKIHPPSLAAGLLTVFGLVGSATLGVAAPQDPGDAAPAATAPAQASAPPKAAPAPAPSGPPTVLLLTNGKVHQGEILRDKNGYILKQKIGVIVFNRRNVERTFYSVEEAYAYKLALCPEDDPDERMKLAIWCLEQKMKPEAKAQLQATLELSPTNRQAKAMLANLDRNTAALPLRDDGIVRAGAVGAAPDQDPDANLNRLRDEFARNPRAVGTPQILDLDPQLAVKRYQEFTRFVHPVLQNRCARCHNEQSQSEFRLIQTHARRDMANDLIVQTNLDATLQIVDRDDLAHSAILSASGMTHGAGGKPVLGGPNSPEYKVLATWVNSLKIGPAQAPAPTSTRASSPSSPPSEGFATRRLAPAVDPAMPPASDATGRYANTYGPSVTKMTGAGALPGATVVPSELGEDGRTERNTTPRPAGSLIPGSSAGIPNNPPPPSEFQTPPIRRKLTASDPNPPSSLEAPPIIDPETGKPIPVMTKAMVEKAKTDAKGRKKPIDTKLLDGFQKSKTAK
ncbi:MAG: hypothetical protein JWN86_1503 [Planctomycetota bacterium]|nr:hypothetical protein [Planctomycetota bacterium]